MSVCRAMRGLGQGWAHPWEQGEQCEQHSNCPERGPGPGVAAVLVSSKEKKSSQEMILKMSVLEPFPDTVPPVPCGLLCTTAFHWKIWECT